MGCRRDVQNMERLKKGEKNRFAGCSGNDARCRGCKGEF